MKSYRSLDENWSAELTAVFVIDFTLIGIAILLHALGMFLQITMTKARDISNQSALLVHLSFASMFSIGTSASAVYHKSFRIRFADEFIVFYYIAYMLYIINLVYLSADRLLFVYLSTSYHKYMTKKVLTVAIVLLWILSIGYGLFIKYAKFINHTNYLKFAPHVYNGAVCLFTLVSYVAVIVKVRRTQSQVNSVRRTQSQINSVNNSKLQQKSSEGRKAATFVLPVCIVLTFFFFNILPSILTMYVKVKGRKARQLYVIGLIGVNVLNNVSDPLLYIFLQSNIQIKLKRYLAKLKLCKNFNQSTTRDVRFTRREKDAEQVTEAEVQVIE